MNLPINIQFVRNRIKTENQAELFCQWPMAIKVGKCSLNLVLIITKMESHSQDASELELEKHGLFNYSLELFLLLRGQNNIVLLFIKYI